MKRPRPLTQTEIDTDKTWHHRHVLPAIAAIDATAQLAQDFTPGIQANRTDRDQITTTHTTNPTANQATNPRTDPTTTWPLELAKAWRQYMTAAHQLAIIHRTITTHADHIHRTGTGSRQHYCANPHCQDPIDIPDMLDGRCEPCALYRRRQGQDPTKTTINARRRDRKRRTNANPT